MDMAHVDKTCALWHCSACSIVGGILLRLHNTSKLINSFSMVAITLVPGMLCKARLDSGLQFRVMTGTATPHR